jgi:hypothetical protein
VTAAFLVLNCGYFAPYGGVSPGPRFLIPCLPFLALGLSSAFRRSFGLTAVLAVLSVIATTAVTLTWVDLPPRAGTIWAQFGSSAIASHLTSNVVVLLGSTRGAGAALVGLAAGAALAVALAGSMPARR